MGEETVGGGLQGGVGIGGASRVVLSCGKALTRLACWVVSRRDGTGPVPGEEGEGDDSDEEEEGEGQIPLA
jgi:hypothetical protein